MYEIASEKNARGWVHIASGCRKKPASPLSVDSSTLLFLNEYTRISPTFKRATRKPARERSKNGNWLVACAPEERDFWGCRSARAVWKAGRGNKNTALTFRRLVYWRLSRKAAEWKWPISKYPLGQLLSSYNRLGHCARATDDASRHELLQQSAFSTFIGTGLYRERKRADAADVQPLEYLSNVNWLGERAEHQWTRKLPYYGIFICSKMRLMSDSYSHLIPISGKWKNIILWKCRSTSICTTVWTFSFCNTCTLFLLFRFYEAEQLANEFRLIVINNHAKTTKLV